jgi:hypothetical protein
MTVVLTIGGLSRNYGGPSHSAPALAEALAKAGAAVELSPVNQVSAKVLLSYPTIYSFEYICCPHPHETRSGSRTE